jgi:hypothetical protein
MSKLENSDLQGCNDLWCEISDESAEHIKGGGIWSSIKKAASWVKDHIGFSSTNGGGIVSIKGSHDLP